MGIGTVLAAALLAGCTTMPAPPAPAQEVDPVAEMLDSALRAARDLPAATRTPDTASNAPVLGQRVTVNYHGGATELLQAFARVHNKELRIRGPQPHLPLFVSVNAIDVPFEDFLRDVGLQFGQRADLVLMANAIEIRYRGVPGLQRPAPGQATPR